MATNTKISRGMVSGSFSSQVSSSVTSQVSTVATTHAPVTASIAQSQPAAADYLFRMPEFRTQDFDIERLSTWEMINPVLLPANVTLEKALSSESVPTLLISGTLLKEITYCVQKLANQELAMMLLLKRAHSVKPKWLAYDFFIPGQTASAGEVAIDVDDYIKYTEKLKEHDYYKENGLDRYLCHLHSHGSLGVFWSTTDITQQTSREEMGFQDDYRFFIVVNSRGDIKADFLTYRPLFTRTEAAILSTTGCEIYNKPLMPERRAELDELLKRNVISRHVVTTGWAGTQLKKYGFTTAPDDGDDAWSAWADFYRQQDGKVAGNGYGAAQPTCKSEYHRQANKVAVNAYGTAQQACKNVHSNQPRYGGGATAEKYPRRTTTPMCEMRISRGVAAMFPLKKEMMTNVIIGIGHWFDGCRCHDLIEKEWLESKTDNIGEQVKGILDRDNLFDDEYVPEDEFEKTVKVLNAVGTTCETGAVRYIAVNLLKFIAWTLYYYDNEKFIDLSESEGFDAIQAISDILDVCLTFDEESLFESIFIDVLDYFRRNGVKKNQDVNAYLDIEYIMDYVAYVSDLEEVLMNSEAYRLDSNFSGTANAANAANQVNRHVADDGGVDWI